MAASQSSKAFACSSSSIPRNSNGSRQPPKANDDSRLLSEVGQKKLSSFPSRQRKMGPAPLASFEDLSMDKTTSDSSSADERNTLPGIGEETLEPLSPNSPNTKTAVLTVPASPRIRVSAASSSSAHDTDSKESTPDKELFIGYTKKDYCEEMSDVKTSTEELLAEEERQRRAKEKLKQKESEKYEEALRVSELCRKESSSSVIIENFLPVTSAHSSRLSSLGSLGSNARRSPSPHRMLLETSFCGSKPIQQPSIDLEDPPIDTTNLLNYTIESLDQLRSPIESCRELSQSPPSIPKHWKELDETQTTPKKSQFQERREKIDHELSRIQQQPSPRRGDKSASEHRSRASEYQTSTIDSETRVVDSKSRMGKKVLPQQAPDLKDFRKTSGTPIPPPPPPSSNNAPPPESSKNKPYTVTPTASPKLGKKVFGKKNKDGTESAGSTPSTSRKSSFSSLFRRGDAALSPVTPDSPGLVPGGRKSPFKELIKSARNEMNSRSRSRSRSKSRDRDLEEEKKGVLSIFKPKDKKKKNEFVGRQNTENQDVDIRTSESITNVEFTFNKQEVQTLSSEVPMVPKESERTEVQEQEIKKQKVERTEAKHIEVKEPGKDLYDSSSSEKSSSKKQDFFKKNEMADENAVASTSYKSVIESLEQKQKEIAERTSTATKTVKQKEDSSFKEKVKEEPLKSKKGELAVHRPSDDSKSESERESEIEYYKKKQALGIEDEHSTTSDTEIKKLVGQDFGEDDELPYVPTTLPLERSQVAPMIPVKDRPPSLKMINSIDRPRSTTPIQPGKLDQYRESIDALESETESEKLTITIPSTAVSPKGVSKQASKSWDDFCNEGLKTPRTVRKEYRESSIQSTDDEEIKSSAEEVFKFTSELTDDINTPKRESANNWINFDELPDMNLKQASQIKTVPQKQASGQSDSNKKPRLTQQKRIDGSKINDAHQSPETELRSKHHDYQSPLPARSTASTPERDDSSERSSDSERLGSQSSSEELTTIREKIAEIKKREEKQAFDDSSDLERLLAPVNDCINKLSTLSVQSNDTARTERKSPIPDNWADFLLPPQPGRRSRLSSLGSETGSLGGRSPSPSHMILETSFCGSQPIHDPGFAEPNVPISVARKMSGISLGDLSPLMSRSAYGGTSSLHQFDGASIVSDSSAEGVVSPKDQNKQFDPHHHRSASEYSTRSAPPAPPRRNLHPFGMDLEVKSNRSSVVSQERTPPESPS